MTKDILVSISGLQVSPEMESDTVEVISPGEYYYRNDKHFVVYEEAIDGKTETVKNYCGESCVFKFHFLFINDKHCDCLLCCVNLSLLLSLLFLHLLQSLCHRKPLLLISYCSTM